jgi:hypothetical protein
MSSHRYPSLSTASSRGSTRARRTERLLENVGDPLLEPVEVIASPVVTHIRYRVTR